MYFYCISSDIQNIWFSILAGFQRLFSIFSPLLFVESVLYRQDSERILVTIPKKRKEHLYSIPRNGHVDYDVPRSTPAVQTHEHYQVPQSPPVAAESPDEGGVENYENMPSASDVNNDCGDAGERVSILAILRTFTSV